MLESIIDRTFDEQLRSLSELIAIPSVSRGEPEPGMPLGKEVHNALEYTLALANRLGFPDTRSLDGYCGVVDYGEGEEMLMVMAHLDVVPAGASWSSDPFTAEVRNGRLYGRGVIDDKGPAVSALYALQAVKEAGIPLKRRVRILLGCDEEKDWACIDRYKKTEPEPDLAFSPDGQYPVVHSEMSICQTVYERKMTGSRVRVDCGVAANVIPGEAEAVLPFDALPVKAPKIVSIQCEGGRIRAVGRGGHASTPGAAQNALLWLLEALAAQPLSGDDQAVATSLHALLDHDLHGEGFGLDISDESGHLTLSPDMLHWDENAVRLTLDCRFPFAIEKDALLGKLDGAMAALGFARTYTKVSAGHFIDPGSELVTTLMDIYQKHTGRASHPVSIGGGTYARAFQNAVAFGVELENEPATAHMPDESVGLDEMRFNTLLIAEGIVRLAGR